MRSVQVPFKSTMQVTCYLIAEEAGPNVSLCTCIRQVLGSNPYRGIGYADRNFYGLPQTHQATALSPRILSSVHNHALLHHPTLRTPDFEGVIAFVAKK